MVFGTAKDKDLIIERTKTHIIKSNKPKKYIITQFASLSKKRHFGSTDWPFGI